MKLGQKSMDKFITKFTSLLRYFPYIWEEKVKVQHFVSILPIFIKEILEFDNPQLMDEAIWKACICYQRMRQKGEPGVEGTLPYEYT